jgi:hypothetical protein
MGPVKLTPTMARTSKRPTVKRPARVEHTAPPAAAPPPAPAVPAEPRRSVAELCALRRAEQRRIWDEEHRR